ncbi:hypothetical protein A2U01_0111269, partial [Trifolium medium]|nr:hypothetical protein [Trifolium medium]
AKPPEPPVFPVFTGSAPVFRFSHRFLSTVV